MASLDDVKNTLYSLAITHKNGIKLRYLLREYNNESDEPLSVTCVKYGFANEIDLLRDANQLIGITITNANHSYLDSIIYAIPDNQTKHIHQLVSEQKNSDDTQSAPTLNPNINALRQRLKLRHRTTNRLAKPKPYSLDSNQQNDTELDDISNKIDDLSLVGKTKAKSCAVCPLPNNRIITVSERQKLTILMNEYYKGINLINFMVVYQYKFKERLNFNQYGYNNLEEFLSDVPDILNLIHTSANDINIMPVSHSKQIVSNNKNNHINHNGELKNVDSVCDISSVPAKELDKFKHILKLSPKGISINTYIKEYENNYGPMIVSNWGYGSPVEMFFHLQKVFYVEKLNNSEDSEYWVLHSYDPKRFESRRIHQKPSIRNSFDNQFKTNAISIIRKMTNAFPNDYFYIEDFAQAYNLVYDKLINSNDFGFKNFKDLFTELCKETDIVMHEKVKNKPYLICK